MRPATPRSRRGWWVAALLATLGAAPFAGGQTPPDPRGRVPSGLRITSPLGRTALGGRIRIVARLVPASAGVGGVAGVRFLVDGALVGTAEGGPFYAVEWTDDNPFEARTIVAEADEAGGGVLRDTVVLPPFELVDRSVVRRILLEAGVYDAADRPVQGLGPEAFVVREDGVVQPLDIAAPETLPTVVVLLVDNSQSMSRRMADVRRAAERFARALRNGGRVIVAPFNGRVGTVTGPTDDAETIGGAISAMRAGGGTAIVDSVVEAARLLDGVDGRRAIILITDGFDENSTATASAAIDRAQAGSITVYAVGIGGVAGLSLPGAALLRALVAGTGGRAYFPWRDAELAAIAQAVSADAHNRYLITYTPTNQKRDGTWRSIAVEAGTGVEVRTRTGYRAPEPPPIRPAIEFSVVHASEESADVSVEDFEVLEDGVAQAIDTFQEAIDPVSIVLALDASGSMRPAAGAVRQTAAEFVGAARAEDSLALVMFADQPKLAHGLTVDRAPSVDAINAYVASGGTALYDALTASLEQLAATPGRRAIVVLSDGRDEDNAGTAAGSTHSLGDVMERARKVGAAIFTIGLGARVDRDVLRRLARESGGEAYFSLDAYELGVQFRRVIENLRRRYVVGYTSTNGRNDGGWREVVIRPRRAGITVAALSGYFAPEP